MTKSELISAIKAEYPTLKVMANTLIYGDVHAYCVWYNPGFNRFSFEASVRELEWSLNYCLPTEENYDYKYSYCEGLGKIILSIEGRRV